MDDAELDLILDVVRRPERPRPSLDERVQLLEDHRRITELVMAYGWLCDRRLWDELLDLYTDDFERHLLGTLEEHLKGKEVLREVYERPVLPRKDPGTGGPPPAVRIGSFELRHLIHPPVVRIGDDGDHAIAAAVYSLVVSEGEVPAFRKADHQGGYIFEFRREPSFGWRFSKMTVISENARNPMFQAPA